jgi:glycerol-3-phosphate acyltransferase PlsY
MNGILALVIAYFVGGIPFGYLLVKLTSGKDLRTEGSGNIGATNALRAGGPAVGIATLLLDLGKGYVAVWLAAQLTNESSVWTSAAALAVMAGHAFPLFLKGQGGKSVATYAGAFLYLTPLPAAAAMVVFAITVAVTRQVSAGSVLAAGTSPIGVWMIQHPPAVVVLASAIASCFVVYRHKSNLERLHAGTESTFTWRKAAGGPGRQVWRHR